MITLILSAVDPASFSSLTRIPNTAKPSSFGSFPWLRLYAVFKGLEISTVERGIRLMTGVGDQV